MKQSILILISLFLLVTGFSQAEGVVIDVTTSEPIPFATIYLIDLSTGYIADVDGKFSYSNNFPKNLKVQVSCVGYASSIQIGNTSNPMDTFYLEPSHLQLEEIIVSSPSGMLQKQTIANVESRKISELNVLPSNNLMEAISNIPSVYQQSTGTGISKPVIRGLSGMRVLTYLNGLRIENQQWGGDHGMAVGEIGIGSVEVIKGPSSLLYGTDALGGVLYFIDEPYANRGETNSSIQSKFDSNTLGTNSTIAVKSAGKNLRINAFANYTNHADYKLPNGNYAKNSRYTQMNGKVSVGFNSKKWVCNLRYNYLHNRIGLPGHSHAPVNSVDKFESTEQSRERTIPAQLISNHYILWQNKLYLNKGQLSILLGHTENRLTEYDEKITVPGINMNLANNTYNMYLNYPLFAWLETTLGVQGMFQQNKNLENATDNLIPDVSSFDNGAYLLVKSGYAKWNAEAGIRVDSRSIKTIQSASYPEPLTKQFNSFNYSLGLTRDAKVATVRVSLSSGYRAPHISELLANGIHHGTFTYEVGDKNLTTENATQLDFSYEFHSEHLEVSINPFYNHIRNYIYSASTDTMIEGLPVFEYRQLDNVYIMGTDVGIHYHPHFADPLHIETSFSYLHAYDDNNDPLFRMPQNRSISSIKYEFDSKSKLRIENLLVQYQYFLPQNRVGINETTSPNYQLVNVGVNALLDIKTPVSIGFGVKNLLNTSYIDHLSRLKNIGIQHPGRNIYTTLKLKF